jgi:hypothetical protein
MAVYSNVHLSEINGNAENVSAMQTEKLRDDTYGFKVQEMYEKKSLLFGFTQYCPRNPGNS